MIDKITRIIIDFSDEVEIGNADILKLRDVLCAICIRYDAKHPGRVMWLFGEGYLMTKHPLALEDDEPIPFDRGTFHFQCAERERYDGEKP